MLNLSHVAAFVAVHECGNFHEASRRLGVAQPTVSQHVQKLEEELGAALIFRTRAGCRATAQGDVFLPFARALLNTARRARETLSGGSTTIGASSNIGIYRLPDQLRRLRRTMDGEGGIQVRIGPNPDVLDWLEGGQLDLALTEWWDGRPGFDARLWSRERLVLILAPDHPWAGRPAIPSAELLDLPLLGGERGTGTGAILRRAFGLAANRLVPGQSLGSTEAVKHAVRAGFGISLVMEGTVRDEVRAGTLVAIPIADLDLRKELWIVHPANLPRSARARVIAAGLGGEGGGGSDGVGAPTASMCQSGSAENTS